jgi:hypothetical protein
MSQETTGLVALVAIVVAALALLLALWLALRVRSLGRRSAAPRAQAAPDVVAALEREVTRVDGLSRSLDEVQRRLPEMVEQDRHAVQHVGVVRYNPFEDTGGQQSFALALLDDKADGVVLSSLHSRQQSRIYLKAITGGTSDTQLSKEEAEAVRRASA